MSNDSITVRLAPKDIERMDRLISAGHFASRSDLIRSSVRSTLDRREVPPIIEEMRRIGAEKGITTEDIVKAVRKVRREIYQEEYGDDDEEDDDENGGIG